MVFLCVEVGRKLASSCVYIYIFFIYIMFIMLKHVEMPNNLRHTQ